LKYFLWNLVITLPARAANADTVGREGAPVRYAIPKIIPLPRDWQIGELYQAPETAHPSRAIGFGRIYCPLAALYSAGVDREGGLPCDAHPP
jgi:hypothetical protein